MAVPTPLRDPDENTGRGLQRVAPGVQGGRRTGLAPVRGGGGGAGSGNGRSGGSAGGGEEWVVVEAEADIAPKSHPYISFDPAGSYP